MGIRCADHVTPLYPQKLALTSPTGGGRSVGIVRLRTKATEFFNNNSNNNNNNNNNVAISADRNVIKKEAEKILKYKDLTIGIQRIWNVKTRVKSSNNRSDWDHFKIIQKIHEQHTRKP